MPGRDLNKRSPVDYQAIEAAQANSSPVNNAVYYTHMPWLTVYVCSVIQLGCPGFRINLHP